MCQSNDCNYLVDLYKSDKLMCSLFLIIEEVHFHFENAFSK